jgi:hypothetical protein
LCLYVYKVFSKCFSFYGDVGAVRVCIIVLMVARVSLRGVEMGYFRFCSLRINVDVMRVKVVVGDGPVTSCFGDLSF